MICHPKTGSQSMQRCLRSAYNARVVRGMHYFDEEECKRVIGEGGIVTCTVRNPWDLMLSWYFYSEHQPKTNRQLPGDIVPFKHWLERVLVSGNGWIEKGLFYGLDQCNQNFRFEHNLEVQLNNSLAACGLKPVNLTHEGKTDHKHYSEYYDCASAVAVALRFPNEIIEFDYKF